MKVVPTAIPDVLILEPRVYGDARGHFFEAYNRRVLRDMTGLDPQFVQDNVSRSGRGVLRGLHYQIRQPQGKLVRVLTGEVYDVAVDLRRSSPSFGRWVGVLLQAESHRQMWIPAGFAHGFCVLSESADILYKATDYWDVSAERTLLWSDPTLAIPWPLAGEPVLAEKDRRGQPFPEAETYA